MSINWNQRAKAAQQAAEAERQRKLAAERLRDATDPIAADHNKDLTRKLSLKDIQDLTLTMLHASAPAPQVMILHPTCYSKIQERLLERKRLERTHALSENTHRKNTYSRTHAPPHDGKKRRNMKLRDRFWKGKKR